MKLLRKAKPTPKSVTFIGTNPLVSQIRDLRDRCDSLEYRVGHLINRVTENAAAVERIANGYVRLAGVMEEIVYGLQHPKLTLTLPIASANGE